MGATSAKLGEAGGVLRGTDYRVLRVLGAGAMGVVLEAEHVPLRRRVVVKVLRSSLAEDPGYIDRLRLEAQTLAAIRSPHVVQVTDFGKTAGGAPFLVMERLYGRTLKEELVDRCALSVEESLGFMRQLLDGLEAAHAIGVVHRDIKPENLFLCIESKRRTLKILDFGIAKIAFAHEDAPSPLQLPTQEGCVVGTPRYIAPEQAKGERVDARSDLYSAAVVLYTMLAGHDPFVKHSGQFSLLQAHATEPPPSLRLAAGQTISRALEAVVLRGMAKNPADRFASARAFRDALDAAMRAVDAPESEDDLLATTRVDPAIWNADPPLAPAAAVFAGDDAPTERMPLLVLPAKEAVALPHVESAAARGLRRESPAMQAVLGQAHSSLRPRARPRLDSRPWARMVIAVGVVVLTALAVVGAASFLGIVR
jgi:serine/threonine-protein kinase